VVRPGKQLLDLTLGVIGLLDAVGGKVMLNHAVSPSLTGFDLSAQQSGKK
jgi:hypothetical protein